MIDGARPRRPRPALPRRRPGAAQHGLVAAGTGRGRTTTTSSETLDVARRGAIRAEVDGYRRYARAAMPAVRLILDAAAEPPSRRRARPASPLRRRLAGRHHVAALEHGAAPPTCCGRSSHDDAMHRARALRRADGVGHLARDAAAPGSARSPTRCATSATVGRPVGGSGEVPDAPARRVRGGTAATLRTKQRGRRDPLRGRRAVRGVALADGTEIDAPSSCRRATRTTRSCDWLTNPPAAAPTIWSAGGGRSRTTTGYESKIDADRRCRRRRRPRRRERTLGADHDRSRRPGRDRPWRDADGRRARCSTSPGMLVNVPTLARPDDGARRGRHVFSLEALFTPYRAARAVGRSRRSRGAGSRSFADCCEPGFLDSIVDWRAMTPDVYERDFHLPAGHATSFAGGPLAAFRNANPELTRYETAVDGPLPHRRGDVPRRRRLGRERPQLRHRHARTPLLMTDTWTCALERRRSTAVQEALRGRSGVDGGMNGRSLSLGRFAGIPVRAHWSMALIVLLFGDHARRTPRPHRWRRRHRRLLRLDPRPRVRPTRSWRAATASRRDSIELWALGGVAPLDREPPTPRADGLIAVAGPAVSLPIAGVRRRIVGLGAASALRIVGVLGWLGFVNVLLAVFNLLPGAPLDGGRIAARRGGGRRTATGTGPTREAGHGRAGARLGDGRHRPRA